MLNNSTKYLALESIRGLAAILIVFYHIPAWNQSTYDIPFIRNGYLMVDLFFVLSGFVIHNAYGRQINTYSDLLRFQFLRFGRLYPVHLIFLLAFTCIEIAKYFAKAKFNLVSPNISPTVNQNLNAWIEQILLVQAIGPTGNAFTFNSPAWSISAEFYTYFLFGFTTLIFSRSRNYIFIAFFMMSFFLLTLGMDDGGFKELIRCSCGFFLGCISSILRQNIEVSLPNFLTSIFIFELT
jgi:peptidoglycan/LPS O-acetylase OafA/YrhL